MQRWFLSYNSQDLSLVQGLAEALERKDPQSHIFFAPKKLRAGGYWLPALAEAIADATAFVLLIGEKGLGPWQLSEYYEAYDRRVKTPSFSLILVLLDGQSAPGLPFLRQIHWITTTDPASEATVARLLDAVAGADGGPREPWRHAAPYRGLSAMTEADSDYFFGRARETSEVLKAVETAPNRLPVLLGNSGVGKSSLAQAGVIGALKRQAVPDGVAGSSVWPAAFHDSRYWCFLKVTPGAEPLKALVEPFLRTWQYEATDPEWEERQSSWIIRLLDGRATLRGLLDATERRHAELGQPNPPAFFLYIDQGEELYVRADEQQQRRFSQLLAESVADKRLRAIMSLRSDFLGALQNDEPLYAVHHKIDVPPLREAELREVVSRPAELLGARFETDRLVSVITQRTAEDSVKDAGALPLLSYTLDDMWTRMVERADGTLRLPAEAFEPGGVLADRANAFLAAHPEAEDRLRRILTLKLATVREDGEPTRRRALRTEFSEEEWRLVSELADHPHRLLVTATPEDGKAYAEVAHEAIFRRWSRLREWMAAEREFLIWKAELEGRRRSFEHAPEAARDDALLMGHALAQAQSWLTRRAEDLPPLDRAFIDRSLAREMLQRTQRERLRRRVLWTALAALVLVSAFAAFAGYQWFEAQRQARKVEAQQQNAQRERDSTLLTQSRFLADLARQRRNVDDAASAALLALEALPDARAAVVRPYAHEAELELFAARQNLREIAVAGHGDLVRDAAFSPDGKRILTASFDKTASIWDVASGNRVAALSGHDGPVWNAAFSPDGARAATASFDRTARIWDAATGKLVAVLGGHTDAVMSVAFSPNGQRVLTASFDKTARLWDTQSGKMLTVFAGHEASLWRAAFSPSGRRVVTASADNTARVWDVRSAQQLSVLKGHQGSVWSAVFSPDGQRVATASADKTARLWRAGDGSEIAAFRGHDDAVLSVAISPDGRQVATASADQTARLWDSETSKEIVVFKGHEAPVWSAVFSRDGRQVLTASFDNTARLWDVDTGKTVLLLRGHDAPVWSANFGPDETRVVTASRDRTARIWERTITTDQVIVLDSRSERVINALFSPDGRRVLTVHIEERVTRIWDVASGRQLVELKGHTDRLASAAAWSPDGHRAITTSFDHTARLWNADTGKTTAVLESQDAVRCGVFTADGRRVVTAADDKVTRIWNVETGRLIFQVPDAGDCTGLSPDGRRLASLDNKQVHIFDTETGMKILTLGNGTEEIWNATFSPDGRRLATAADQVRVWDTNTGRPIAAFEAEVDKDIRFTMVFSADGRRLATESGIWDADTGRRIADFKAATHDASVRFSRDGKKVLTEEGVWDVATGTQIAAFSKRSIGSLSPDGERAVSQFGRNATIWNTATGEDVAVLAGHANTVVTAVFSPDGRHVVTASEDGTARIWRVFPSTQDLVDDAKRAIPRCLERSQREAAFLDPEPPAWCIEMAKWPYQTSAWKDWLTYKRANAEPPLPDTPEWHPWLNARKNPQGLPTPLLPTPPPR